MDSESVKSVVSYTILETRKIVSEEYEKAMQDMATSMTEIFKRRTADLEARLIHIRGALEDYACRCDVCNGCGSVNEFDTVTERYLWRNCPECGWAREVLRD